MVMIIGVQCSEAFTGSDIPQFLSRLTMTGAEWPCSVAIGRAE